MWMFKPEPKLVAADQALSGRAEPILAPAPHAVLGTPITGPWKEGQRSILIALGCFWGAEKMFWETEGVESTSVGYAGGTTPNPTYYEVCRGLTNHAEVVEVVYDPQRISLRDLVVQALEAHDPTQGFRQGNDVGTQYRSAFYPRKSRTSWIPMRTSSRNSDSEIPPRRLDSSPIQIPGSTT